jgi:hypothetical protein
MGSLPLWTFHGFPYIAPQHEALFPSGVNGLGKNRGPGPRFERLALQFTRGALLTPSARAVFRAADHMWNPNVIS